MQKKQSINAAQSINDDSFAQEKEYMNINHKKKK